MHEVYLMDDDRLYWTVTDRRKGLARVKQLVTQFICGVLGHDPDIVPKYNEGLRSWHCRRDCGTKFMSREVY